MFKSLSRIQFVKMAATFVALLAVVYFFTAKHGWHGHEFHHMHSRMQHLSDYLSSLGMYAVFFAVALIFFQTFFPVVPFLLIAGTNVLVFGFVRGYLLNYSMTTLAAVAAFLFARYIAHDWAQQKLDRFTYAQSFRLRLRENGFFFTLIGRFIAFLPSSVINWAAGLSAVSFRSFLWATIIGNMPIVFLESSIGHDLLHFRAYKGRLILLLLFFSLLIYGGNMMKRKWLHTIKEEVHERS